MKNSKSQSPFSSLFEKNNLSEKWIQWGMVLWIGSSVFRILLHLPFFGYKIQLFDIFAFSYFFLLMLNIPWKNAIRITFSQPLIALFLITIFNFAAHPNLNILFDLITIIYFCLVPFIFVFSLMSMPNPHKIISQGMLLMSILLLLTTFGGYLAHVFDLSNDYVFEYKNYPYLGTVYRVTGFMISPNLIVFLGSSCLFYLLFIPHFFSKKVKFTLISFLSLMLFLTFSKEVILIPAVLVILYLKKIKTWNVLSKVLSLAFIFFITLTTFFYFSTSKKIDFREDVIKNEPIAEFNDLKVYPTAYYFLWKSSIKMIKENVFTGVGFGNFIGEIDHQKKLGNYPPNFENYLAHDNYTGLIAQFGIGFLIVLILFFQDFNKIIRDSKGEVGNFLVAMSYFILFFGFVYNSYNLRFMWMLLGILSFYAMNQNFYKKTNLLKNFKR